MANNTSNLISNKTKQGAVAKKPSLLGAMISQASVQERFEKMLGKRAGSFLSSVLSLANNNKLLAKADPRTILSAAGIAASLDLSVNPTLGQAWIIPYNNKASFQLGYRGIVTLAQRSGVMKSIVATEVYEGEIQDWNRFTETYKPGEKVSDEVVGFYASFELINGFKKAAYWSKDEVWQHAKRFSKSFNSGPWVTDFNAMAKKTVLMSIMRTYAPLSTEMQFAVEQEGQVTAMKDNGEVETIDVELQDGEEPITTEDGKFVDPETGEIIEEDV